LEHAAHLTPPVFCHRTANHVSPIAGKEFFSGLLEISRVFAAYCGNYTFDGTKAVTVVDGASSPEMKEDQVRHIRFEGSRRMIVVPVSRLFGRGAGLELVWERIG
jgi:hypothetical protein